jgi:predicted nicotinamide N-methyase
MDDVASGPEREQSPIVGTEKIREGAYSGPLTVCHLKFGEFDIRLVRPVEPDRLLDDPDVAERNRQDDYMPYWAYLWPASYLLAQAVAAEPWPAPPDGSEAREILEIGCGLGLAGLVALARGLRVQFSDYDASSLEIVRQSACLNGFAADQFSTRRLDWRSLPDERHEVIIGADVLYEARLVPLVADVLDRLLAPAGIGILATPHREAAKRFPACLEDRGLSYRAEAASARTEKGDPIEGIIYRVMRTPG